jgi:Phosphate-selective porin O and P
MGASRRRTSALLALLLLAAAPAVAAADDFEIGLEDFLYRSKSTLLNRDNVLGLDPTENLLRVTAAGRKTFGKFAFRAAAFVERQTGRTDETNLTFRQAFAEYKTDDGFLLRAGKQKIGWGSGFVWNPTARLEPPKSPANPGTEQPGIDAVRMDISPADWASITLVAGRAQANLTDLPGSLSRKSDPQWSGAVRARLLVNDTDIALTYLGGNDRAGLWGFDLGRTWGPIAMHAESALYRGSEIDPGRADESFLRVAAGALWTPGNSSLSFEYFFNSEGMNGSQFDAYTARLDRNLTTALDPRVPEPARNAAFAAWSVDAAIPFASNLGLRRHYASVAFTRNDVATDLDLNLRAVSGLSDRGLILTPGVAYAPTGNVQMSLDIVLLFGPQTAEYKLAPIERAFQARLKYSF